MRQPTLTATLIMLMANAAYALDYTVGDLTIMHPVAKPTTATAMTGAGYLTIVNNGDKPDTLLSVEAAFPRVMLHNTVMDGDVAKMEHLMSVEIAPGETLTLEPGGMHVMFMGLNGDPFEIGEEIPATLVFENAGTIDVTFNVEEITGDAADHSGH